MKTMNNKLRLTFLLALIAAVICCVSVAFAGIFSVNKTASADAKAASTSEKTSDNSTSDNANISTPTPIATYNLRGTRSEMATMFNAAVTASDKANGGWVKVVLQNDWIATPDGNATTLTLGTAAGGMGKGRIYIPGGPSVGCKENAKIILDLNGYTIDRGLSSPTAHGSVIYVKGSLIVMDGEYNNRGGMITGGYSTVKGGGIYVEGGNLTINGGIISGNRTEGNGGGVSVEANNDATGTYYGYATGNFTMNGGIISGNTADHSGGGVHIGQGTNAQFKGGSISGNTGGESGGGVKCNLTSDEHVVYFDGTTISGNYANNGGGIYVMSGEVVGFTGGAVSGNRCSSNGGGIYVEAHDTSIHGISISGNITGSSGYGGGIYVLSGLVDVWSGSICDNIAGSYGGGIYSYDDVYMHDGLISGNKVLRSEGNGLYWDGSNGNDYDDIPVGGGVFVSGQDSDNRSFHMYGGVISNNYANGGAGGVYAPYSVTITDGKIIGNTAKSEGGGIWCGDYTYGHSSSYGFRGDINITGGEISNNTAKHYGGAIYANFCSFIVENCKINNNTTTSGSISGICAQGNGNSDFYLKNSEVSYNSNIGVRYTGYEYAEIDNCIFAYNVRGIVLDSDMYTVTNSKFIGNGDCGIRAFLPERMDVEDADEVAITDCEFIDNNDGIFADVNGEKGNIDINNCVFSGNRQGLHTDANSGYGTAWLSGSTFTGNQVGIYNYQMYLYIHSGTSTQAIKSTSIVNNNIGIDSHSHTIVINDTTIASNNIGINMAGNTYSTYELSLHDTYIQYNNTGVKLWHDYTINPGSTVILADNYNHDIYFESNEDSLTGRVVFWSNSLSKNSRICLPNMDGVTITNGFSDDSKYGGYDLGTPSDYFCTKSSEYNVYKLNGEVYVAKTAPQLSWSYNTNGGSSYSNATGTAYTNTYTGAAWSARARYGTETTYKTIKYYKNGVEVTAANVKNVGTYVAKVIDSTSEWGNGEFTFIINKATITAIGGVTASNKVYDGTTSATVNVSGATFTGKVGNDALTLLYTSATFENANAGDNKTVTLNGVTLGGAAAENYQLGASVKVTATANIAKYETTVKWTDTSVDYSGSAQGPKATYKTVNGTETTLLVGGIATATNVGTYKATVTAPANYTFTNAEYDWKINKAEPTVTAKLTGATGLQVGDAMPEITVSDGDTEGKIVWVDSELMQGTNKYGWIFIPKDGDNYLTATGETELEVAAAEGVTFKGIKASYDQTKSIPTDATIDKLGDYGTLTVKETYSDGTEAPIAANKYKLSLSGDKLVEGSNKITVTYEYGEGEDKKEYTAEFTVFVVDDSEPTPATPVLTGMTATFAQEKNIPTTVNVNQLGDYGTLTVLETYDNGSTKAVTAGYTLAGPEGGIKAGANVITVTYTVGEGDDAKTYTAKFSIFANERTVVSIKATYTAGGDIYTDTELDDLKSNLSVVANYSDGSTPNNLAASVYTLSVSGGKLAIGENTILVTYSTAKGVFNDAFKITVVAHDPATKSIEVIATQTAAIYSSAKVEDLADKLNLTVNAVNGDGFKTELLESEYEITAFDVETGEVTVTLKSNTEITAKFTVVVTPKAITKITVDYTQGITVIYPDFDIATLNDRVTVKVHYNDGSEPETLAKEDFTIAGNLAVGTSTLSVTYEADGGETYATTFTVNVTAKADTDKTTVNVNWRDLSFVFDGKEHEPVAYYFIDGGKYEVRLTINLFGTSLTGGKAINAGTYRARVDETSVKEGYALSGDLFKDFVIEKAEVTLTWTNINNDNTYTGNAQTPPKADLEGYTVNDGKVNFAVEIVPEAGYSVDANGNAVNAGKYKARLVVTDGDNYTVVGDIEYSFTIAPKQITKPTVDTQKEFASLSEAVEYVKGVYGDKEVKVSGVENANGGYDITVTIADEANYKWANAKEGEEHEAVKFSFATVTPNKGGESMLSLPATIALSAVLAVAAVVAIIAFVVAILKPKRSVDSDGFYEAYVE